MVHACQYELYVWVVEQACCRGFSRALRFIYTHEEKPTKNKKWPGNQKKKTGYVKLILVIFFDTCNRLAKSRGRGRIFFVFCNIGRASISNFVTRKSKLQENSCTKESENGGGGHWNEAIIKVQKDLCVLWE